jgi:hypothetical protein
VTAERDAVGMTVQTAPDPASDLLTVGEAMEELRCSESTVRRLIQSGELPARIYDLRSTFASNALAAGGIGVRARTDHGHERVTRWTPSATGRGCRAEGRELNR